MRCGACAAPYLLMTFPPPCITCLVTQIAAILREREATLAISEAACGGLLSAYMVLEPGALNFYIGGKLVYALRQRLRVLGWLEKDVAHYVGPSETVVLKLARNTRYELGLTYVLSESGFAGPTADLHLDNKTADESLVGTVYLGLSGPNGDVSCTRKTGLADRATNMEQFAKMGLEFLLQQLTDEAS